MKHTPEIWTPEGIIAHAQQCQAGLKDGRWVAARPLSWGGLSLKKRFKAAWAVFCGKYDVLRWEGQD